jgi:hypothetical protein
MGLVATGGAALGGLLASGLGVAAGGLTTAIGTGIVAAGTGAALGAGEAALTGSNVGKGALFGGITGGVTGGVGGALGSAIGSPIAGDAIAGAAGGALGGAATGQNVLTSGLEGGAAGLASGLIGSATGGGSSSTSPGGVTSGAAPGVTSTSGGITSSNLSAPAAAPAGASAASVAAPAGVSSLPTDLRSGTQAAGGFDATPSAGGAGPSGGGSFGTGGAGSVASQIGATPSGGTTGAGGGASAPTAANANSSGFLGNISKSLGISTNELVGGGISSLGLLKDFMGNQQPEGTNQLSSAAASEAKQGSVLSSYLTTGTLPPAVQQSVDAATRDGITAIKSRYASMGAGGSSGEAEDIAHLQQNAVVQGASLADQLMQQGLSESNMSAELYQSIIGNSNTQNAATSQAISGLAAALAGGGTTLKVA